MDWRGVSVRRHPGIAEKPMSYKDRVFAILDESPETTIGELAGQVGCTFRTAEAYRLDWKNQEPEPKRCKSCGLAFELVNPEMVDGECLMCNLSSLGVAPRDFYEAGGSQYLIMRESPSVVASAKKWRLRLEIELLRKEKRGVMP